MMMTTINFFGALERAKKSREEMLNLDLDSISNHRIPVSSILGCCGSLENTSRDTVHGHEVDIVALVVGG